MSRTDDFRAVLNGTMTHTEYEERWPPVTAEEMRVAHERTERVNTRINRWEMGRRRAARRRDVRGTEAPRGPRRENS